MVRKNIPRVLLAMSGGVDSTMAAVYLREEGWDVVGAHMQLYDSDRPRPSGCCTFKAAAYAREMARLLDIPFHVFDFRDAFLREIILPFTESYRSGKTPNPCVICNDKIKFGLLREKALELGAGHIATGHYARIQFCSDTGRRMLLKSLDRSKDQSYFLFTITQEQAGSIVFPLGGRKKKDVRAEARELGLPVWEKEESQEICFIPEGDYRSFMEDVKGRPVDSGQIVDLEGNIIGRHKGIFRYTVGQRRGLGIASTEPYFVVRLEPDSNRVVVGRRDNLSSDGLLAMNVNWISGKPPEALMNATVRIRYKSNEIPAVLEPIDGNRVRVRFLKTAGAVTPGQAAVFYSGEEVLGGGWIERGL